MVTFAALFNQYLAVPVSLSWPRAGSSQPCSSPEGFAYEALFTWNTFYLLRPLV